MLQLDAQVCANAAVCIYIISFLVQFMGTITHFSQGTIQNAVWEADHSISENTFQYDPKGRIYTLQ
jgi:hypothetical protein